MGNPGDAKYGMTRRQIFDGVKKLMGLGAKKFGLHAFLASNTTGQRLLPGRWPACCSELAVRAAQGHRAATIDFVNLSGGVGVPYRPEQPASDIARHRRGGAHEAL